MFLIDVTLSSYNCIIVVTAGLHMFVMKVVLFLYRCKSLTYEHNIRYKRGSPLPINRHLTFIMYYLLTHKWYWRSTVSWGAQRHHQTLQRFRRPVLRTRLHFLLMYIWFPNMRHYFTIDDVHRNQFKPPCRLLINRLWAAVSLPISATAAAVTSSASNILSAEENWRMRKV